MTTINLLSIADPVPVIVPCVQSAKDNGYTKRIEIDFGPHFIEALVKPGTDYDSSFRCFCLDGNEWLVVNGWLAAITEF